MPVNRAPTSFFGSKFRILDKLYTVFPPAESVDCYLEPCFGMGTAFFNRDRLGKNEVVNDANSDIYNFFRVLREDYNELTRLLKYTPYNYETFKEARTEIQRTRKSYKRKNIYRAWGVYVNYTMSVMKNGIGFSRDSADNPTARNWKENIKRLDYCAARLSDAVIENDDCIAVCKRYDSPGTFIYLDPDYMSTLNKVHQGKAYRGNRVDHPALIEFLLTCKSRVAISNYHNELYDSSLTHDRGFYITEVESYSATATGRRGTHFSRKLTECIWTNFAPSRQLSFA